MVNGFKKSPWMTIYGSSESILYDSFTKTYTRNNAVI